MSVNDSIDPRFLFHVEDESLRFRVGESGTKSRELETVGDRRFRNFGIRQGFEESRLEKDESRYPDGDEDEEDVCVRRHGAIIQPGIDSGDNCDSAAEETKRESKNPGIFSMLAHTFLYFALLHTNKTVEALNKRVLLRFSWLGTSCEKR